ncbi:Phospholipase ddhd1 [Clonorchis sinensis]|uniref:Phospholipase ddhd1 n=1 Tax=Clonorchis sinensis TaxID=79923 RepID=A0A8T1MTB3_CLOSI|nr:Phospholipase ddhd1 [Clonorchis sinensis]
MTSCLNKDEIPVEAVRWFYGQGSHALKWKRFRGADSINIERAFREQNGATSAESGSNRKIVVRGDLFEADVSKKVCSPIFWHGQRRSAVGTRGDWCTTPIERGIWFNKINWIPLDFDLASIIEEEHVSKVIPKLRIKKDEKSAKHRLHKFSHGNFSVMWMNNGDVYLITRSAEPFRHVKLQGDLSSVPINRGYRDFADPRDCRPPITHLCFVVHGIGQQLASVRHECSKLRKVLLKVARKRYPGLESSGHRLEFIPVDWRSALNLNCGTLENITVGQMRPLRMYINNCFIDVLYYTSPVYRAEIMKSLSWELTRLFNLFLRNNPHFLQKGGQVSVFAHSLGTVIMHDILRYTDQQLAFVSPPVRQEHAPTTVAQKIANDIDKARSDLFNLELKMLQQMSMDPQSPGVGDSPTTSQETYLSSFRRPASWKPLPQLAHLFLVGSPLGLFISLNSVPEPPPNTPNSATNLPSTPVQSSPRRRKRHNSGTSQSSGSSECPESGVFDFGQPDPEALIPFHACRRVYNIFHSYDPIAYRLEPLLMRHYTHISPVVLPTVSQFFSKKTRRRIASMNTEGSESTLPGSSTSGSMCMDSMLFGEGSSDGHVFFNETPQNLPGLSDSNTESSDDDSTSFTEDCFSNRVYKRLSVVADAQTYRQHKSKTFKLFSRLVTRRSSNVTSLGPLLTPQRKKLECGEKRLLYRVDYEWQKSFSPWAVLGAHYSYWDSEEVAFFMLYQIFGPPDTSND